MDYQIDTREALRRSLEDTPPTVGSIAAACERALQAQRRCTITARHCKDATQAFESGDEKAGQRFLKKAAHAALDLPWEE